MLPPNDVEPFEDSELCLPAVNPGNMQELGHPLRPERPVSIPEACPPPWSNFFAPIDNYRRDDVLQLYYLPYPVVIYRPVAMRSVGTQTDAEEPTNEPDIENAEQQNGQ